MAEYPIPIPLAVFHATPPAPSARLLALVAKLDTYACFSPAARQGRGHRPSGRRGFPAAKRSTRTERPRIGLRELSRDDLCRKDFLSLMNKLSPQNYQKIWKAVAGALVPDQAAVYCDVLWTLMHRQSRLYLAMYAEIAWAIARTLVSPHKMAFKAAWDDKWLTWVGDVAVPPYWAIGEAQRALLAGATSASEDGFNELLAWKKSRLCVAQACTYLCHKGILTHPPVAFLAPVAEAVTVGVAGATGTASTDFLDYYLDLLTQCLEVLKETKQPLPPELKQKWNEWAAHSADLPALCRFKILDLIENDQNPADRGQSRGAA
jgi:hypothetical protein